MTRAARLLLATLLCSPLLSLPASAQFLPEEALRHARPSRSFSDITEAEFQAVIGRIQATYSPVVRTFGGNLSIRGDWRSDKLNAGATQMGSNWQVVITGALARRPELTADGFALILCHELGHHLAGFPFAAGGNPFQKAWAANEGQADYFSTHACARRLWGAERELNAGYRATAPDLVRERCDTAYGIEDEQNLCYRVAAAGTSVTNTMAGILNKPAPSFATPDPAVVPKTSDAHPAIQCRMDTIFQGAICPEDFGEDLIPGKGAREGLQSEEAEREAARRSCTKMAGHVFGLRPLCWFKPRM